MLVESSCCKINKRDLKPLSGSQSHRRGSLCFANPREKEFVDSELVRCRVSKLLLEVAVDLGLNLL